MPFHNRISFPRLCKPSEKLILMVEKIKTKQKIILFMGLFYNYFYCFSSENATIHAMKVFRPLDFLIFAAIISLSIFSLKKANPQKGSIVHIHSEKGDFQYSLDKNAEYKVEGPLGETIVQVKDRKVRIIDSPCPGKTCISQGYHSPIVCMPNKVIVSIENYGEFDAVSE